MSQKHKILQQLQQELVFHLRQFEVELRNCEYIQADSTMACIMAIKVDIMRLQNELNNLKMKH